MQELIKQIDKIRVTSESEIKAATDLTALNAVRVTVLGKSGTLTQLLRGLKDVAAEDKPKAGQYLNAARVALEELIKEKEAVFNKQILEKKLSEEKIDITINRQTRTLGSAHPLYQVRDRVVDFFAARGFQIVDSPEIETEHYNFDALNMPFDHPARDTQDTFYIADKVLLRTQTSSGQIRTMEKAKPPIKMITVGKVYRSDDIDATHSPVFHQIEGLAVDKGVTMCDLKGILSEFAAEFFGADTVTRFRPSHFPFTEPSVEVDATCPSCKGKGCRVCKGTGWIEILGAGMVNRHVLEGCNIDPDIYTGFAFGVGLDRITLIIHGITDLRLVYENDLRFLKQFTAKIKGENI